MMYEPTTENARIKSTQLRWYDAPVLTVWLHLEYAGGGQGFGGYALDAAPRGRASGAKREPSTFAGLFIAEVLRTLEVEKWEDLPGTYVRVRHTSGRVEAIGHIVKDRWFSPDEAFARYRIDGEVA
jgi:hypothetical protein